MKAEVEVGALRALLSGKRVAVLTGAGCSTESGIPDYRGPGTRARARNPVEYRAFMNDPDARARYWARSLLGWPRLAAAEPNDAHRALAELERRGHVTGVITQNVDRLHHKAGSRRVVELHGASAEVICIACHRRHDRDVVQAQLEAENPRLLSHPAATAPDGDAELTGSWQDVVVPACAACDGVLKPHVVFFGESVPQARVAAAWDIVDESDALLVVGSSLAVFSGFRFVRGAHARKLPIAIVNLGDTRGDPLATLTVRGSAGAVLRALTTPA